MFFATKSFKFLLSVVVLNVVLPAARAQDTAGISVVMGSKQYYIDYYGAGNFYQGVHFCAQFDMKLASIESKAEYDRLSAILRSNGLINRNYWLSANSFGTNGVFNWLGIGKPVNYWGEEEAINQVDKCLIAAKDTFKFTPVDCIGAEDYSFICEKPLTPNCGSYGQCRYTYSYNTN